MRVKNCSEKALSKRNRAVFIISGIARQNKGGKRCKLSYNRDKNEPSRRSYIMKSPDNCGEIYKKDDDRACIGTKTPHRTCYMTVCLKVEKERCANCQSKPEYEDENKAKWTETTDEQIPNCTKESHDMRHVID
jgi:hypothetical protein